MAMDSQALIRLVDDRNAATARLQVIEERLSNAQQAVARWTSAKAMVEDEILDIDEALVLVASEPGLS
jgi:hypothetical protein